MIIPYSATASYSLLLSRLSDEALKELATVTRAIAGESPQAQRDALMEVMPALGTRYEGAVSEVSAAFSGELMEMQEVKKPVAPDVLTPSDASLWTALAGWGTSERVLERGGMLLAYSLMSGGLTKRLTEFAADTMIGNMEIQTVPGNAQRVPRPGCCAFCGMLASRGAVYTSSKSAGEVGGRGVELGQGKGRGSYGKGKGIRTRGTQAIGESFHDACRCRIVTLTEGNYAQLQSDADKYYEAYRESADKVNDGLTLKVTDVSTPDRLKNKYEWVTDDGTARNAKERTADILTAMRLDIGVK